jgi:hypothetical protein
VLAGVVVEPLGGGAAQQESRGAMFSVISWSRAAPSIQSSPVIRSSAERRLTIDSVR